MLRNIIGVLMIIGGIALGLYVGIWVCFVGGIIQVIQQVRAEIMIPMQIGIGIIKILFAGFLGYVCTFVLALPGWMMIHRD